MPSQRRFDYRAFMPSGLALATLALLWTVGHAWLDHPGDQLLRTAGLFVGLFAVILWCAVGVMRHAEVLAHRLGEPSGALILTLSAVTIEVSIIAVIMLVGEQNPHLARDTMFAILMIILGGLVGTALLAGGLRHRVQSYNLEGARSFLVVLLPLATITLILPSYTVSTADPTLTLLQGALFGVFTLLLYGVFLVMQTRRHREFFQAPEETPATAEPILHQPEIPEHSTAFHVLLLILTLAPIRCWRMSSPSSSSTGFLCSTCRRPSPGCWWRPWC